MRDKLHKEKRDSKGWWRAADRIMEKRGGQQVIPVLRNSDAVWVRDPADNANLLARTLSNKFILCDLIAKEFSFDGTRSVTEALVLVRRSRMRKTSAR